MAVWQICETFSAKLLITAVFFFLPPTLRFGPSKNSQQSEQPIRTYVGLEAEGGREPGCVAIPELTQTISHPPMGSSVIGLLDLHVRDVGGKTSADDGGWWG